jgi:hypothetical protein
MLLKSRDTFEAKFVEAYAAFRKLAFRKTCSFSNGLPMDGVPVACMVRPIPTGPAAYTTVRPAAIKLP